MQQLWHACTPGDTAPARAVQLGILSTAALTWPSLCPKAQLSFSSSLLLLHVTQSKTLLYSSSAQLTLSAVSNPQVLAGSRPSGGTSQENAWQNLASAVAWEKQSSASISHVRDVDIICHKEKVVPWVVLQEYEKHNSWFSHLHLSRLPKKNAAELLIPSAQAQMTADKAMKWRCKQMLANEEERFYISIITEWVNQGWRRSEWICVYTSPEDFCLLQQV